MSMCLPISGYDTFSWVFLESVSSDIVGIDFIRERVDCFTRLKPDLIFHWFVQEAGPCYNWMHHRFRLGICLKTQDMKTTMRQRRLLPSSNWGVSWRCSAWSPHPSLLGMITWTTGTTSSSGTKSPLSLERWTVCGTGLTTEPRPLYHSPKSLLIDLEDILVHMVGCPGLLMF